MTTPPGVPPPTVKVRGRAQKREADAARRRFSLLDPRPSRDLRDRSCPGLLSRYALGDSLNLRTDLTAIVFPLAAIQTTDYLSPETGRTYLHDAKEAGLVLVITATGRKTFQLYKKHKGRPVRVKLGYWPETTVEQARKKCREEKVERKIHAQRPRSAASF